MVPALTSTPLKSPFFLTEIMRFNLPRHSIPWTRLPSSSKVIFFRYLLVSCDCVYRLFVQRVNDLIKLLSPLELPSLAFVIVLIASNCDSDSFSTVWCIRMILTGETFLPCYLRFCFDCVLNRLISLWSSLCLFQFLHTLRHNATLHSNFSMVFWSRHLVSAVNPCSYGSGKKLIFIRHIPCIGLLTAKTLIVKRPNNQVQKRW